MKRVLLTMLASYGAAFVMHAPRHVCANPMVAAPVMSLPLPLLATLDTANLAAASDSADDVATVLQKFQDSHAVLISIVTVIATRYVIYEARQRIEKPVMDKVTTKTVEALTPDSEQISPGQWAKLGLCVALDLAGDASAALPFVGEFTDAAYAPLEGALLVALFKSNLLAGFGFLEEILPFTDVVPTFSIGWALQNLWPTTPLAKGLGVTKE